MKTVYLKYHYPALDNENRRRHKNDKNRRCSELKTALIINDLYGKYNRIPRKMKKHLLNNKSRVEVVHLSDVEVASHYWYESDNSPLVEEVREYAEFWSDKWVIYLRNRQHQQNGVYPEIMCFYDGWFLH